MSDTELWEGSLANGPFKVAYDANLDKELPWCVMNCDEEVVNHFVEKKYADKYNNYLNDEYNSTQEVELAVQ